MYTHISDDICFDDDRHTVVIRPDYSVLDALYMGRRVRFGDYHVHSGSDGIPAAIGNPIWLEE